MSHVIARLKGGLGNQMFQFATGYAVAQRLDVPLLLDTSVLDLRGEDLQRTTRAFELDVFALDVRFATLEQVAELERSGPLAQLLSKIGARTPMVVAERDHDWNAAVASCQAPVLLDGYWQNEQYFLAHAAALREHLFVPADPINGADQDLLEAIRATPSASLHVRRGDYAHDPATHAYHGLLPLEYFTEAADMLIREQGVQRFFVFSDDPEWIRAHVVLPAPMTVVSHNAGRNAHWDLFLMKNCGHHIIANSSFSWWGAWLNPHPGKVVIGPRFWFSGDAIASDRILPSDWIRLPLP
jgi:hypothetical protein